MGKKIIYVIVLLLAILGVYNSFFASKDQSIKTIKKNVHYVRDGKINKANEGKLVVVSGQLKSKNVFENEELGIKIKSCYIKLEYQYKSSSVWTNKDDKYTFENVDAKIGDYFVPASKIAEMDSIKYYHGSLTNDNFVYDKNTGYYTAKDRSARFKIQYLEMGNVSVLGKQKGNTFTDYKIGKDSYYSIYSSKIRNNLELDNALEKSKKASKIITSIILLIVLLIGYTSFYKKKKKEEKVVIPESDISLVEEDTKEEIQKPKETKTKKEVKVTKPKKEEKIVTPESDTKVVKDTNEVKQKEKKIKKEVKNTKKETKSTKIPKTKKEVKKTKTNSTTTKKKKTTKKTNGTKSASKTKTTNKKKAK